MKKARKFEKSNFLSAIISNLIKSFWLKTKTSHINSAHLHHNKLTQKTQQMMFIIKQAIILMKQRG